MGGFVNVHACVTKFQCFKESTKSLSKSEYSRLLAVYIGTMKQYIVLTPTSIRCYSIVSTWYIVSPSSSLYLHLNNVHLTFYCEPTPKTVTQSNLHSDSRDLACA